MTYMSKRAVALAEARIAGYHENTHYFTRLLIEARVNHQAMLDAYRDGFTARDRGITCGCKFCQLSGIDR